MSGKKKGNLQNLESWDGLVPRLRFPEFKKQEAWRETTLNVIAKPVTDRVAHGADANILSLSGEHGIVLQSEFFGKKVAGDNSERYLKIVRDDFVYNDRTTKASTFGTIKRLSKLPGGIVSPIYKCFRFIEDENPVFWEWYFDSGIHNKALAGLVNEGARAGRFNISITQFLSTNALRPAKAEQQKIANCLTSIDELITAQAQKVEALKTHKKGLMQQLFPREGESEPRLRFPEFRGSGEWMDTKLGEYVEIRSGYSPSVYKLSSTGKYAFVKVEDLNNCSKYQVTGREFSDDSNGLVPRNSILFPKRGAAIALNKIRITTTDMLIDTNLMALTAKKGALADFLFYYLTNLGLSQIADTSTIPQINNKHILPFDLCVPGEEEQHRIAATLTSLDTLITAESQKLETLKLHKRGLMQQLFPSPDEVAA